LPLTNASQQLFEQMVKHGDGELDNAAVLSVLEREAGVKIGE
jgi:3-hydroxyisobutyrate dehydrogenase-like beta-hydroxyacid dehydrogenase